MTGWEVALIIGMAAVTFGVRYPVLALVRHVTLPALVTEGLRFIPPAVLTAIIVPAIVMPRGTPALQFDNAYLMAGLAAAMIAWWSKNLLLTICLGMAVFWLWRYLAAAMLWSFS